MPFRSKIRNNGAYNPQTTFQFLNNVYFITITLHGFEKSLEDTSSLSPVYTHTYIQVLTGHNS